MSAPTIRVLLTEDVLSDAELEVRELKRAGLRIDHRIVESEESFERALREFAPDVILSDFSMPHFDGMAALALARELAPDTPFIFVSGTIGEEYAIRALKNGATDYVVKSNLVRLPAAVERAIAEARERREKRRAEIELEIARARLTSIFASLPDALWSADAKTGELIYISPASAQVLGYPPEALLADVNIWWKQVHAEDLPRLRSLWERTKQGAPLDVDYRFHHPDGGLRWINARGRPIAGADGTPERVDGMARDVTERVEQAGRLARLQRIRELSSSVNAALVRLRSRNDLFEALCAIALDAGRFVGAHVGVVDGSGAVRWAAQQGTSVAILRNLVVSAAADETGHGIVGRALRSRRPAVWNDLLHDPDVRFRERFLSIGVGATATFPLVVDGKAIGVFGLHASEPGFFDQDEMRMLEELSANISFALELIAKQDQISYLAFHDVLTGMPNRELFHERLTQAIDAARRAAKPMALALFDLDRFKAINDTLGRSAGDSVLKILAGRLVEAAVQSSRVARLGSDQFAVIFADIGSAEEVARRVEHKLNDVIGSPIEIAGQELRMSGKAGIAVFPEDGADADSLFRNVEAALKRAKETGERYLYYSPGINARVSEMVELERFLRLAVEKQEFFLHFQPKLELASRRMVGLEALLRWNGPKGVQMSPARFVPVLEQTGLILEAGRQALSAANAAYRAWKAKGLNPPRIAVNVSAIQLRRPSFVEDVRVAIGDLGNDGGGIDLEVTESLLMADIESSIRKLEELRAAGLHIALDDFGTGFSSLSYLSKLPIDTLKIDRSFIHGMTERADDTSIVSTIISLAQALRLKVVAEGVETEQQAQLLRLLRCDQAQGYLFNPPLPAERIEALLKSL